MPECRFLAIDLPKNVFQLHGAASDVALVFKRRLMRDQLSTFVAKLAPCQIAWRHALLPTTGPCVQALRAPGEVDQPAVRSPVRQGQQEHALRANQDGLAAGHTKPAPRSLTTGQ